MPTTRVLLILLLAISARDALGFECHRRLLSPEDGAVYFERDSSDDARVDCWLVEEVIVTG